MKIFKTKKKATAGEAAFYGQAPTERELNAVERANRLRVMLDKRDREALAAEAKLRELLSIYELHATNGDTCVVYTDPEGALDEMWDVLSLPTP